MHCDGIKGIIDIVTEGKGRVEPRTGHDGPEVELSLALLSL